MLPSDPTAKSSLPEPEPLPPGPLLVQLQRREWVPAVSEFRGATQGLVSVAAHSCWPSRAIGPTPVLPAASPLTVPVTVAGCPGTGVSGLSTNSTLHPLPVWVNGSVTSKPTT